MMLKLSRGVKKQNQLICYTSQNLVRSRNLRKSPEKRGPHSSKELGNHDHKSHHCNKTGHIARASKAKKRHTQAAHPPIHYVDGDEGDSNDYLRSLEVNNERDKDHVIWVNPEVQGG